MKSTKMVERAAAIAPVHIDRGVYIEERPVFVQIAQTLGISVIRRTDCPSTRVRLATFELDTTA
jgi:hypothetical protein